MADVGDATSTPHKEQPSVVDANVEASQTARGGDDTAQNSNADKASEQVLETENEQPLQRKKEESGRKDVETTADAVQAVVDECEHLSLDGETGGEETGEEEECASRRRRRRRDAASSESEEGDGENSGSEETVSSRQNTEDELETKEEDGWEEEGGGEGNVEVEVEVEGEEEDGDGWEEEGEADGKGKAEGEGEGEESSPMFVPTKGVFFQHDVRYMSGDDKEQEKSAEEEVMVVQTRADVVERWGHDLYMEADQGPRQQWEKDKDTNHYAELEKRKEQSGRSGGRTMGDYFQSWGSRTEGRRGGRGGTRGGRGGTRGGRGARQTDGGERGERSWGGQTDEGQRRRTRQRGGRFNEEKRKSSNQRGNEKQQWGEREDTETQSRSVEDWEEETVLESQPEKIVAGGRREGEQESSKRVGKAERKEDLSSIGHTMDSSPHSSSMEKISRPREPPESLRVFQSKTFSLTADKRLVISSNSKSSSSQTPAEVGGSRGRGRGRGDERVDTFSTVGASRVKETPPKQESLPKVSTEKEPSPEDQFADASEDAASTATTAAITSMATTAATVTSMGTTAATASAVGASDMTVEKSREPSPPQSISVPPPPKPKRYSRQRQQQRTGQAEIDLAPTTDDPNLQWASHQQSVAANMGSLQEVPTVGGPAAAMKHFPSTLIAAPLQVPQAMPVHTGQPEHSFQTAMPTVIPTSQGTAAAPLAGQQVEWGQFQVQMQLLSQQNPAFFEQMQQYFWSHTMAMQQHQMQQLHQLQPQHYHPQLPQQPMGNYNVVNFPATAPPQPQQVLDQKGGSGSEAQYVPPVGSGLFIPPPTHLPPPPEDAGETRAQSPRRSLAIPIVPPKE